MTQKEKGRRRQKVVQRSISVQEILQKEFRRQWSKVVLHNILLKGEKMPLRCAIASIANILATLLHRSGLTQPFSKSFIFRSARRFPIQELTRIDPAQLQRSAKNSQTPSIRCQPRLIKCCSVLFCFFGSSKFCFVLFCFTPAWKISAVFLGS